jgi:hypothetical protein
VVTGVDLSLAKSVAFQLAYISAIGQALDLPASDITIVSVTLLSSTATLGLVGGKQQSHSQSRALSSGVSVGTSIASPVVGDQATYISSLTNALNTVTTDGALTQALQSAGFPSAVASIPPSVTVTVVSPSASPSAAPTSSAVPSPSAAGNDGQTADRATNGLSDVGKIALIAVFSILGGLVLFSACYCYNFRRLRLRRYNPQLPMNDQQGRNNQGGDVVVEFTNIYFPRERGYGEGGGDRCVGAVPANGSESRTLVSAVAVPAPATAPPLAYACSAELMHSRDDSDDERRCIEVGGVPIEKAADYYRDVTL